jgi:hypothetical protein
MEKGRFETIYSQGLIDSYKVIVDMETGVNYLYTTNLLGVGITVLLDSDGKPVITNNEVRSERQRRTWWERIFK